MTKLLLVEDNVSFRASVAAYLQAEGYVVDEAANGVSALNLAYLVRPRLVIADILLPSLGGVELCRLLKSSAETHDISVILMTGVPEFATDTATKAGADAFLRKPFDMQDLVACVSSVLTRTG
jgi:DNA-binding response OmpR family regulator